MTLNAFLMGTGTGIAIGQSVALGYATWPSIITIPVLALWLVMVLLDRRRRRRRRHYVRTWAIGEPLTASMINAHVRDSL